ncbi:MAG TPA: ATP-binding cassette domain-containing protein, partial [Tianweitania sediminis]|nr:ATP-binding cassette domain-containing protein [Tianweitania sediminis]
MSIANPQAGHMPLNIENAEPILEIRGLAVEFANHAARATFKAVKNVSFKVHRGRTLCIVGESGSGKSVTARTILGLIDL